MFDREISVGGTSLRTKTSRISDRPLTDACYNIDSYGAR